MNDENENAGQAEGGLPVPESLAADAGQEPAQIDIRTEESVGSDPPAEEETPAADPGEDPGDAAAEDPADAEVEDAPVADTPLATRREERPGKIGRRAEARAERRG